MIHTMDTFHDYLKTVTVCSPAVEIDAETYDYFHGLLPPIYGAGCFYMSEAIDHLVDGVLRSKFYLNNGRYFHELAVLPYKPAHCSNPNCCLDPDHTGPHSESVPDDR